MTLAYHILRRLSRMADDKGSYRSPVLTGACYGPPLATMRVSSPTTETRWIETNASLSAREREENLASYVHRLRTDVPDDVVPSFSSLVPSQTNVTTRSRPARFLARTGGRFLFTIHVTEMAGTVDVRLVSGGQLLQFVHVNRMAGIKKDVVQLWVACRWR